MHTHFNPSQVLLSVLIAVLAAYVGFDLAGRIVLARGRARLWLILFGGLALSIGIWSMHFVGMFALDICGMPMMYDTALVLLSLLCAFINSAICLYVLSRRQMTGIDYFYGALAMMCAVGGMHYTAMRSMLVAVDIEWNPYLVAASLLEALVGTYFALRSYGQVHPPARPLDSPFLEYDDRWQVLTGSVWLGMSVVGLHYTGMSAATFRPSATLLPAGVHTVGNIEITTAVIASTLVVLVISIVSGTWDRSLARAAQALYSEKELRNNFISILVHDLRNPLTAAMMGIEAIRLRFKDQATLQKLSVSAIGNLKRMDQMIQTLLDAQRISRGELLPVRSELCDLTSLLQATLETLTDVYGPRFKLECPVAIVGHWDRMFVRRAVENLCTNAVKYGDDTAPVRVTATLSQADPRKVLIHIQNQGEPLSPEEQQNLFRLFNRGRKAEQSQQSGWGLGLTVVKAVAEGHGGAVRVASDRENGTVFTIEIPLHVPSTVRPQ